MREYPPLHGFGAKMLREREREREGERERKYVWDSSGSAPELAVPTSARTIASESRSFAMFRIITL